MLVLTLCGALNAQEQDTIVQKPKLRTVYITLLGVGFPECYNLLKFGYQINEEWSVGVKLSGYYSESGGDWNFGVWLFSLQAVKYFPNSKIIFNNISLSGGYLPSQGDEFLSLELYTGWEGTYRWVRPYWAVGFSYVSEKYHFEKYHYFYPGFKVGLNFNL
jgi:hypothetical protein